MIQSRGITYSESRCCEKLILPFTLLSFKSQLPVDLLLSNRSFIISTQAVSSEYMKLIYASVSLRAAAHVGEFVCSLLLLLLLLLIERALSKIDGSTSQQTT